MSASARYASMPDSRPAKPPRNLRLLALLGVFFALSVIAVYVYLAPRWREARLQKADLPSLQREAKAAPNDSRVLFYLGKSLLAVGDVQAAFDALTKAADGNPNDLEVWETAAQAALLLRGPSGAFNILGQFVRNHPENPKARIALAQMYADRKAFRQAYVEAKNATELAPQSAEAWRLYGISALVSERYPEAETALQHALALNPADWQSQNALGDVLNLQNRPKDAAEAYRVALKLAPNEAAPLTALARTLITSAPNPQNRAEAQKLLQKSVSLQSQNPLNHLYLGRVYALNNQWEAARTAFERAITLDPTEKDPYFELSRAKERLGDVSGAAAARRKHDEISQFMEWRQKTLRLIQEKGGDTAEGQRLRLELARAYAAQGRFPQAAEQYSRLLELNPNRGDIRRELAQVQQAAATVPELVAQGDAAMAKDDHDAAIAAYLAAVKKDESNAYALEGVGLAVANKGDLETAVKYLAQATKIDPTRTQAQIALAQMNLKAKIFFEARYRLEIVTKNDPKNAAAWHLLGIIVRQTTHTINEPESLFGRAVTLEPTNPIYLMDYADAQLENHQMAEAEATFRKALQFAPNVPEAEARVGGFLSRQTDPAKRQEGENLLRGALKKLPDDIYAQYALARVLLQRKETKEAIPLLERVIKAPQGVDLVEVWNTLARAYGLTKEKEKARTAAANGARLRQQFDDDTVARERVELNPEQPALRLNYARVLTRREDYAKALREYDVCLRLDPKNAAARSEKAALEKRLTSEGRMPSMRLFNTMLAAREAKHPEVR